MVRSMAAAIVLGLTLLVSAPAMAESPDWGSEEKAAPAQQATPAPEVFDAAEEGSSDPFLSVTMAPILLFASSLELMAEVEVLDFLGVALIPLIGQPDGVTLYGVGVGVNFYPFQNFRSLFLGGELQSQFARLETENVVARGSGFGAGGYLGFKAVASFGLTFVGQLGYRYMDFEVTGTGGGVTETYHFDSRGLLLRLNLGWSF